MECLICARQDDWRVCTRCVSAVEDRIKSLRVYYRKLADYLAPGSAGGGQPVSGGSTEAPLPVRVEVLNLRGPGGIVGVLAGHEDDWRAWLGWTRRPFRGDMEQTLDGTVTFLERNWTWCADKHPAPEVFAQDVRYLVDTCRLHTEGRSDVRVIGECPVQVVNGTTGVCGAKLFAAPYLKVIRCFKCRTEWEEKDWLKLARMMRSGV